MGEEEGISSPQNGARPMLLSKKPFGPWVGAWSAGIGVILLLLIDDDTIRLVG